MNNLETNFKQQMSKTMFTIKLDGENLPDFMIFNTKKLAFVEVKERSSYSFNAWKTSQNEQFKTCIQILPAPVFLLLKKTGKNEYVLFDKKRKKYNFSSIKHSCSAIFNLL